MSNVTWKAVTGLHLSGREEGTGVLITFHSVLGEEKNFGILVKEDDLKGFADFFAHVAEMVAKAKAGGA